MCTSHFPWASENRHFQGELGLDLINPLGRCVIDLSGTRGQWKGAGERILRWKLTAFQPLSAVFFIAKLILEVEL